MVRKNHRGFTIIEVSLVMALTLGLLSLIGIYFSRGQSYAAQTRSYADAQSAATSILRRISDQAYRGTLRQRDVQADGLVFLSYGAAENDVARVELERNTGKIVWKKWVGYYFDPTQKTVYQGELPLLTKLYDLGTPAEPAMTIADFRTDPRVAKVPMPGKVRDFRVSTVNKRIRIQITTEAMAPIAGNDSQKEITVQVSGEVAVYN